MSKEQEEVNDFNELVKDFMNTMLEHKHCIRSSCCRPMPNYASTRDGVCLRCKAEDKAKRTPIPPMI